MDANIAAALSYLVGFVTGVIFLLVEKENKFVRFHAMQSTLLFAGIVAVDILLQLIPFLGALVFIFVVVPASAVLWLLLMYKAYQGERFKVPVAGEIRFRDDLIWVFVDSEDAVPELSEDNNLNQTGAVCDFHPPVGSFSPQVEWQWSGSPILPSSNQVIMTPAVVV